MPPTQCELIWYSPGGHVQQLYTGFLMLHARGLVRLSHRRSAQQVTAAAQHLKDTSGAHLSVRVDGRIRLHYDCHDAVEVNEGRLADCDFYFKRSYSQRYVDSLGAERGKVFPLGLYYRVLPDRISLCSIRRSLVVGRGWREKLDALLDALDVGNRLRYRARVRELEALPDHALPPRVLFLAAAHDPYDSPGRSAEKIEEMVAINDTRAQCIGILRRELGTRFFGGFIHNAHSMRRYREFLVDDNGVTRKRNYIRLLKSFPICVATAGLHGSTGGKFAEYVALAKAIVSEKLDFEVPGELQAGRNYLEFGSPQECAAQALRLVEDRAERSRLMFNNALYYQSWLRPDALVLGSLLRAFAAAHARPGRSPAPMLGEAFA